MKEQVKTELERAFRGKGFWVSLLIGVSIAVAQVVAEVYPRAVNPLNGYVGMTGYPYSLFNFWIGMKHGPYRETYLMILPILATMPYGLSYHQDIKNGYVKNIYTRGRKADYLAAKYIAVFVTAGTAVVLPFLLNLLISACMLPALRPSLGGEFGVNPVYILYRLYLEHPFVYIGVFLGIMFIYAGVFASIALAAARLVENIFLLSLVPFVFWYGMNMVASYLKKFIGVRLNPIYLIQMAPMVKDRFAVVLVPLVIGVLSAVIYFGSGVKSDALE